MKRYSKISILLALLALFLVSPVIVLGDTTKNINQLTNEEYDAASGDYLGIWDTSAGTFDKIKASRLSVLGYVADSSEVDQGLEGNGRSLEAYITDASTNSATVIFTNHGAASTTYTYTTSGTTVPATMTLKFQPGAIIDGAGTLPINGFIDAGRYQIFGSSITLTGSPQNESIYPEWFGAVGDTTCDSGTTPTWTMGTASGAAFQQAFDWANEYAKIPVSILPGHYYNIDSALTVDKHGFQLISEGQRMHNDNDEQDAFGGLVKNFSTDYMITITNGTSRDKNKGVRIEGIHFTGKHDGSGELDDAYGFLSFSDVGNSEIVRCAFMEYKGRAIYADHCDDFWVRNSIFSEVGEGEGDGTPAIEITDSDGSESFNHWRFSDCRFERNFGQIIKIKGDNLDGSYYGTNFYFDNCKFHGRVSTQTHFHTNAMLEFEDVEMIFFNSCHFTNSPYNTIDLTDTRYVYFINSSLMANNCHQSTGSGTTNDFIFEMANAENTSFVSGRIQNPSDTEASGVSMDSESDFSLGIATATWSSTTALSGVINGRYIQSSMGPNEQVRMIIGSDGEALDIRTSGDTWPKVVIDSAGSTGRIRFSDGTVDPDVNLYRGSSADVLKTDDHFFAADGLRTFTKEGAISDSDTTVDSDGTIGVDVTNHRLYFRSGTTWWYIENDGS